MAKDYWDYIDMLEEKKPNLDEVPLEVKERHARDIFEIYFGTCCGTVPDCRWEYVPNDKKKLGQYDAFYFDDDIEQSQIFELMEKSAIENHDYVYDCVKNNGEVLDPDVWY